MQTPEFEPENLSEIYLGEYLNYIPIRNSDDPLIKPVSMIGIANQGHYNENQARKSIDLLKKTLQENGLLEQEVQLQVIEGSANTRTNYGDKMQKIEGVSTINGKLHEIQLKSNMDVSNCSDNFVYVSILSEFDEGIYQFIYIKLADILDIASKDKIDRINKNNLYNFNKIIGESYRIVEHNSEPIEMIKVLIEKLNHEGNSEEYISSYLLPNTKIDPVYILDEINCRTEIEILDSIYQLRNEQFDHEFEAGVLIHKDGEIELLSDLYFSGTFMSIGVDGDDSDSGPGQTYVSLNPLSLYANDMHRQINIDTESNRPVELRIYLDTFKKSVGLK